MFEKDKTFETIWGICYKQHKAQKANLMTKLWWENIDLSWICNVFPSKQIEEDSKVLYPQKQIAKYVFITDVINIRKVFNMTKNLFKDSVFFIARVYKVRKCKVRSDKLWNYFWTHFKVARFEVTLNLKPRHFKRYRPDMHNIRPAGEMWHAEAFYLAR